MQADLFFGGENRLDKVATPVNVSTPDHYLWSVKVASYFLLPHVMVNCFLIYLVLHHPH